MTKYVKIRGYGCGEPSYCIYYEECKEEEAIETIKNFLFNEAKNSKNDYYFEVRNWEDSEPLFLYSYDEIFQDFRNDPKPIDKTQVFLRCFDGNRDFKSILRRKIYLEFLDKEVEDYLNIINKEMDYLLRRFKNFDINKLRFKVYNLDDNYLFSYVNGERVIEEQ